MSDDAAWRALEEAAARLDAMAVPPLEVRAARRSFLGTVSEGLEVSDPWTDVWEPVRRRDRFGGAWAQVTSVDQAEEHLAAFLRERPDLA